MNVVILSPFSARAAPHVENVRDVGGVANSCIGQHVAVIEVEEAVAQVAKRSPNLRVNRVDRDFTTMFQNIAALAAN